MKSQTTGLASRPFCAKDKYSNTKQETHFHYDSMWNVYDIEQSTMEPISKMKNKCF